MLNGMPLESRVHGSSAFNLTFLSYRFFKCDKISCKFCDYSNYNSIIDLNNFYLPIMSKSNCKSINLIYIIYCNKWLYYHIKQGEV